MLAQSVVHEYGGRVRFVVENYGESALATRFGVRRYPAVFVDDVLVATPKDFGFYGKGEGAGDGRYTPWRSAESHERFRGDLRRMIGLVLAHQNEAARAQARPSNAAEIAALPPLSITTLDGRAVSRDSLAGRVVLVEFWATWCPPCRGTLRWLGELERRYGDRLDVIAVAVESEEAEVRRLTQELALPIRWTMGSPELARSFGDVSAVPTLLLFDAQGRTAASAFGASPDLHRTVESKLQALLGS